MKLLPDTRHFLRPSALTYFQKKSLLDMKKNPCFKNELRKYFITENVLLKI